MTVTSGANPLPLPLRSHQVGRPKHLPHVAGDSIRHVRLFKNEGYVSLQNLPIDQPVVFQVGDQQARKRAHRTQPLFKNSRLHGSALRSSSMAEFYAMKNIFTASKIKTFSEAACGGLF